MNRTTELIKKKDKTKIVKLYTGSKKNPGIGARRISKELGIPRRQVFRILEEAGVAEFSEASYT